MQLAERQKGSILTLGRDTDWAASKDFKMRKKDSKSKLKITFIYKVLCTIYVLSYEASKANLAGIERTGK
jgi:hypothetical protein